jgi:hypothetical protein
VLKNDSQIDENRNRNIYYCGWRSNWLLAFLFLSLILLVIYGDDGQGGHPSESLKNILFFGTLGIFPICGFVIGFKIAKNMFNTKLLKNTAEAKGHKHGDTEKHR